MHSVCLPSYKARMDRHRRTSLCAFGNNRRLAVEPWCLHYYRHWQWRLAAMESHVSQTSWRRRRPCALGLMISADIWVSSRGFQV